MNHKSCGSKGGQRHELTEVVSSAAWPDGFLTHEVRLCVVVCAERVLKRVFPLRLLHLERMFSACVCLFPTFVGWYCLSHAGFLFHRGIADIFQSNRTSEGMVFTPKFVIKNVSCRKTSKRSDSVENAELTNIASNRMLSHSLFAKDVVPILDASFPLRRKLSANLCMCLASVGCLHVSLAGFFFHNDTSDVFQWDRDAPTQRSAHAQACEHESAMEQSQQTYGQGDRTANAVSMDLPNEDTSSFSDLVLTWRPCGGHCGKEIEMPGPALPVPTTRHRQTVSRQSSSPKWMETNRIFWKRSADDGPFQERFLLHEFIVAHCKFLPSPTIPGAGRMGVH